MGKTFNLGDPAPVGRRVLVKNWLVSSHDGERVDRIFTVYGQHHELGNWCHGWFKIGNPGRGWQGMLVYPPQCELVEEDQASFAGQGFDDKVGYASPTKYAVLHPGRIRNES